MIKMETSRGSVRISNEVFTTITGAAAVGCFGVKGMAMRSRSDGLVHLLRREAMAKGVYVTYNDDETISIELHIVVDHGVNIPVVCHSIIEEVGYKVNKATGVVAKSVDVYVDSMIIG